MLAAGTAVPDFAGGTRLGETMQAFLDRWGQRWVARRAVSPCSPMAGRRRPSLLGDQLARLKRLAHAVFWVNPHAGGPGTLRPVRHRCALPASADSALAGHTLATLKRFRGDGRMRDVLGRRYRRWSAGRITVGLGTVVANYTPQPPRAPAGHGRRPDGTVAGSVSGGLRRGCGVRARAGGRRRAQAGAAAYGRHRRRRLRGRPDLRAIIDNYYVHVDGLDARSIGEVVAIGPRRRSRSRS